jgi:hypothetical protein
MQVTAKLTRSTIRAIGMCMVTLASVGAITSTGFHEPREATVHSAPADYTFGQGYVEAGANGGVYAFGNAPFDGSVFSYTPAGYTPQTWLGAPMVGIASVPGNTGYWVATSNGIVCGFGSAQVYNLPGNDYGGGYCYQSIAGVSDIVGIVSDPANGGYWLVGSDGGVFTYGGAPYLGNAVGLGATIVAMASTPDGGGYWLVAGNGAVYAPRYGGSGDSNYSGGMNGTTLSEPIVGIAAGASDSSYWMVGGDGGVFGFGGAPYLGSLPPTGFIYGINGVASIPGGQAFYLMSFDGSIFTYGSAQFQGDIYGNTIFGYGQIVGVAFT